MESALGGTVCVIAHSEWKRDEVFEGVAENGNTVIFDANAAHTAGPSPMEAVLMAAAARGVRKGLSGWRSRRGRTRETEPLRFFRN